jgi:hypothetical protein
MKMKDRWCRMVKEGRKVTNGGGVKKVKEGRKVKEGEGKMKDGEGRTKKGLRMVMKGC